MTRPNESRPAARSAGDIAKTLAHIRERHLKTPRDGELATHLDRLLERDDDGNMLPRPLKFTTTGETRGVLVVDAAGGGKTTLVSHVLKNHPVLGRRSEFGAHYIGAEVPSPATFKNMGQELLKRSGYQLKNNRRDAYSIWEIVKGRLQDSATAVLWIDEAHDLFCKDKDLILRAFKSLMKGDQAIVPVLSGTQKLLDFIRQDNEVQRRFSTMILPPVSATTEGRAFAKIIREYCDMAGLDPPGEPDLIPRLVHAARYRLGRSIELITGAIEQALMNDSRCLLIDHFAGIFTLQEAGTVDDNIFLATRWEEINPDGEENNVDASRGRRGRGA